MVAAGFAAGLTGEGDMEVLGTVGTAADGLDRIHDGQPAVAIVDQALPDGRGTDLAVHVREVALATKVLIVSAQAEETLVSEVVDSGCAGLVSKSPGAPELVRAVRAIAAGQSFL